MNSEELAERNHKDMKRSIHNRVEAPIQTISIDNDS